VGRAVLEDSHKAEGFPMEAFAVPSRTISNCDGQVSQLLGNILEIARQKPDATRVAGLYAWNQLGRRVKKGERGIRILAPVIDPIYESRGPVQGWTPISIAFHGVK